LRPERHELAAAAEREQLVERRSAGETDRDDGKREGEFDLVIYSAKPRRFTAFPSWCDDEKFRIAAGDNKSQLIHCCA